MIAFEYLDRKSLRDVLKTASTIPENIMACASAQVSREFLIDNLLVRIHSIVEMMLVDRPCAMGI